MARKRKYNKLKLKLSQDVLPLFNKERMSYQQVADHFKVDRGTVIRWVKKLREAGYEVKTLPVGNIKTEI